jgi:hypothetical protein
MAIVTVNHAFQASCDITYNLGWATTRNQTSSETTTNNECNAEASANSDPRYKIKRGFITFNTNSSLPAGNTVSSVVLRIAWGSGFGNQGYYVVPNAMASPTAIAKSDYNKLTGTAYSAKFSGTGTLDVALTGLTIVNTGYTKIGIIHYYDYENSTPPTGTHGISGLRTASLLITYTTPPVVTTNSFAQNLNVNSAVLLGEVTDVGGGTVSSRGVCWATSANPTTSNSKATSAGGLGQFQVNATGLYPATLYNYRAYVTTENSTTYGANRTFVTFGGASGVLMM